MSDRLHVRGWQTQTRFSNLSPVLGYTEFVDERDKWIWKADPSRLFTIKSVRMAIQKSRSGPTTWLFQWNKWAPLKVNVFAWWAEMNRVPTKQALQSRNINVSDMTCPFCGERNETIDHLLISCSLASQVWTFISNWCKIPQIYAFEVCDLFEIHKHLTLSYEKKKVIQLIIVRVCWMIWKMRNDLILNNVN